MKKYIFLLIPIIFIACNQDEIEKTKELNRNNIVLKKEIQNFKKSNIDTKDERILKLNNKKDLDLEKLKKDNTLELAKVKNENATKLAKIEAQKEQKLKEIALKMTQEKLKTELQKTKLESNKSIVVAKIENSAKVKLKKEDSSFYKIAVVILAISLIIWAILRYLSILAKKRLEAEIKEKEQAHEAYIQELKLKHENINKMLDIISDEKSDKEIKKAITKILERGKGNLIEYKKP